jgi:hypothetical protein
MSNLSTPEIKIKKGKCKVNNYPKKPKVTRL